MKSCSSLLLVLLMFLAFYTNGQTNTFPLYSSGAASGGSGDYTNVTNGQLKLQATSGYIRAQHISADAGVSAVFNFQTGKTVYWGETTDAGQYQFRGRDFILVNGKLGIGTSSPAYKLDVNGPINSTGGFLTSGNVGIGVTTPSGALHVNGVNANGWTYLSGNVNGAGNPANIQGLQLGWNRTGIQG